MMDDNREYFHEDALPEGYPYNAMYPYSWVDGVRLFPSRIPFSVYQSEKDKALREMAEEIKAYTVTDPSDGSIGDWFGSKIDEILIRHGGERGRDE